MLKKPNSPHTSLIKQLERYFNNLEGITHMSINEETVKHVAKLAKLEFKEEEIHDFTEGMDKIINLVEQLEDLDTTGVEGTYHGITHHSVLREDKAKLEVSREDLFTNVKTKQDGFIKVPAIMENGESGA